MNALPHCPICKVGFIQISHNHAWLEEWCKSQHDCPIEYRQFHEKSFDDPTLRYITFRTKTFYYYSYFVDTLSIKSGVTHIYFNVFPRGESVQSPAFTISNLKIDWDNLDKLDEKYRKLVPFL